MLNVSRILIFAAMAVCLNACQLGGKSTSDILEGRISSGDVTGKVILEDGGDPSSCKIIFSYSSESETVVTPKSDGTFLSTLKEGTYTPKVSCTGYNSQTLDSLSITAGTFSMREITLIVTPGPLQLTLKDKEGVPYSNLTMALMNGLPPGSSTNYTTNSIGVFDISNLEFGNYHLTPTGVTSGSNTFLWAAGQNQYTGTFIRKANLSSYDVILPKVKYFELSGSTSAPTLTPTNERFYAQSFTLSSRLSICGVGFGVGLGGSGTPNKIQVRSNGTNEPSSTMLFENTPVPFTAAISTLSEAGYISICNPNTAAYTLEAGTYWVVAKYNSVATAISVLGGSGTPQNGSSVKSSSDGTTWSNASLPSGWHMLNLFLVE